MKLERRLYGIISDLSIFDPKILAKFPLKKGFTSVTIFNDDSDYEYLLNVFSNLKDFSESTLFVHFSIEDRKAAQSYMLRYTPGGSMIRYNKQTRQVFEMYFGKICELCGAPYSKTLKDIFHLPKVPKIFKDISFNVYPFSYYWITTHEKFEKYFKPWGLSWSEITVGKEKLISEELVLIDFPTATSELEFGDSKFAQRIEYLPGVGCEYGANKPPCKVCGTITYTNQHIDFFPDFKQPNDFAICKTQEWFYLGPKIIYSRDFLEFLIKEKKMHWNHIALDPVKKFT